MTRSRLAARVLVLVVVALGYAVIPVESAGAQSRGAQVPRLDLVTQSATVEADGTFLLTVDLQDAPLNGRVAITLHRDRVTSRAAFSRTLFGVDLGDRVVRVPAIDLENVATDADGNRRFTVVIALKQSITPAPGQIGLELGLGRPGAYPLELVMFDEEEVEQTKLITHLVRLPTESDLDEEAPEPLRAALLLPLTASPTVGPDGSDLATDETFASAAALTEALAAEPDVPLTLDPTPETIEGMARHSAQSKATLETLESNLSDRQVLDGTYVELGVTSWLNADMTDEFNRQRARGSRILNDLTPDSSTWVADASLTTAVAAQLWEQGVRRLVLRPESFTEVEPSEEEPTLPRPIEISTPLDRPMNGLAVDTGLQAAFGRQTDPELTVVQMMAELSVIQGEAPTEARGVVLAAPTGWEASTTFLTALLGALDAHPQLRPVTLDNLFRQVRPATTEPDGTGDPLVRRLTPLPPEDLGEYPTDLAETRQRVASYSAMVGEEDPILSQWDQRLLLSGSSSLTPSERRRYLQSITSVIDADVEAIESPERQTVTLTAREGNIPLTVRSALDQPVKVVLALESNSRLEFPAGEVVEHTLNPGSQQIQIRVLARSPGDTRLTVRVLSPDSGIDLTDTRITVRSTAVSGIGYVLSGGAALFLLVWWGRHWRRDRRARRTDAPMTSAISDGAT